MRFSTDRPDPIPFIARASQALGQSWALVAVLTVVLGLLRLGQLAWHWPANLKVPGADLALVLLQGARFDLKASAILGLLLWPLFLTDLERLKTTIQTVTMVLFIGAGLVNLHYYGFYKTPIDPIVFGLLEDDTAAVMQTIWHDFPVVGSLVLIGGLTWATLRAQQKLARKMVALRFVNTVRTSAAALALSVLLGLFLLLVASKGTLRAMALSRQHTAITTSGFLNDMVPNGVMALKFAWDGRQASQNFDDPTTGLRRLGFASAQEAAHALGLGGLDETALRKALVADGPTRLHGQPRHLLFFLMESWSAEPFLYHDAKDFEILGRMAEAQKQACHFSNVDSTQAGTHPSLEALLYSSPITPLTQGIHGRKPIAWAVARLMKQAGYRTVFLTSARAGWRELDRVLPIQGFDEVIDASHLQRAYPQAEIGIWGVWDEYVFRYLKDRLAQKSNQPLFVFTLTSTNHPPYDLPSDHVRVRRDPSRWGGERISEHLWPNLDTWRYATDLLGGFVQETLASPQRDRVLIAATGDHNVRTFGLYATPDRRHLLGQVPFMLWGKRMDCGSQRQWPASHRDIFPTLLPLVGIEGGYLKSGRNLLAPLPDRTQALSVNYYGGARNAEGSWLLGKTVSFVCKPRAASTPTACAFDAQADVQARAQVGLLDWYIRKAFQP